MKTVFLLLSALVCGVGTMSVSAGEVGLAGSSVAQDPEKQAVPVRIEKKPDGSWELLRDGKPYRVEGGGGEGSLKYLAECGGNSTRTWGVGDETLARLDEAHELGLTVTLGIWLEHERKGFSYDDEDQVQEQTEKVLAAVAQYKDHPALLAWGIGNEMEGATGDNPAIWKHVEFLANRIHELDPHHPTMTVIAEIGGEKVSAIHKQCPSIDIIGVNSYGGCASLPDRYRAAGGTKPYIVTEFGPNGPWEVSKNGLGVVDELTSTAKTAQYREKYAAISADKRLCLGSYAFLWGNKQEATATWFGLLLPSGDKTGGVDVLEEYWSGVAPKNRCPEIARLEINGANEVAAGSTVKLVLKATDPENDSLTVNWVLMSDAKTYITNGDFQKAPPDFPELIISGNDKGAEVKMPDEPGLYRIYAYVHDGKKGAATGNLVLRVRDQAEIDNLGMKPGAKVELPYVVFDEGAEQENAYYPTGWMGSTESISLNLNCKENPKSGDVCLECKYSNAGQWGGVVWQNPANDWGDKAGGLDLRGASKMTFWARGNTGGEVIGFGFGLLGADKNWPDTGKKELEKVVLNKEWTEYTIDLDGVDLRRIKTGFFWTLAGQGDGIVFYLDNIKFE